MELTQFRFLMKIKHPKSLQNHQTTPQKMRFCKRKTMWTAKLLRNHKKVMKYRAGACMVTMVIPMVVTDIITERDQKKV